MTTCYIYALVDPQVDEIFYIGSSTKLEQRFNAHINGNTNIANQRRIKQIFANGHRPEIRILDKVSEELRLECEKAWIDKLGKEAPLTNVHLVDNGEIKQERIVTDTDDSFLCITTVRLPMELYKAVKKKAIDMELSLSEVIRRLLKEWLEGNGENEVVDNDSA